MVVVVGLFHLCHGCDADGIYVTVVGVLICRWQISLHDCVGCVQRGGDVVRDSDTAACMGGCADGPGLFVCLCVCMYVCLLWSA